MAKGLSCENQQSPFISLALRLVDESVNYKTRRKRTVNTPNIKLLFLPEVCSQIDLLHRDAELDGIRGLFLPRSDQGEGKGRPEHLQLRVPCLIQWISVGSKRSDRAQSKDETAKRPFN